ncbi:hypothetical protein KCU95_g1955, partial [Aureobasidium melanogenum]
MTFIFTSYFERFPDFDHQPRQSIRIEFNRLAKAQNELDVKPRNTVDECRKILRYTHVNLVDLMDARRDENTKVKKFKTYKELRDYSHKTKKFYPLDDAKGELSRSL